jgi:hypothetical protein
MNYSKRDLQQLDTIEQAWDGSELKIEKMTDIKCG